MDDKNKNHFSQVLSALMRVKSITIAPSNETTTEWADQNELQAARTEGKTHSKSTTSVYHSCEELDAD